MRARDHSFLSTTLGGPASTILSKPDSRRTPNSADEQYVVDTLIAAAEIASLLDQLQYATDSLSGYRRRSGAQGPATNRAEYIAYHLENHLIRCVALHDRALLLANIVFQLGLSERACSRESVTRNRHVAATPVAAKLAEVEKLVGPYREQRNVVVHRRGYSDPQLHEVEGFYLLENLDRAAGDLTPAIDRAKYIFKRMTDTYVTAKKRDLASANARFEKCVGHLFDALEPEFAARCRITAS